jgi:membrane-associated HD superfamily phosphohydrolase
VECGEPDKDESKKPKCDSKTQYTHVMVDSEGKAVQSCKQTRKFYNRKGTKPTNSDVRAKIKDSWNKLKPDYDKKNQERQNSLKKLKEIQEERDRSMKEKDDKIKEANDKKKERLAKCDTPIALLLGAAFNEAMSKRDGEHPYDWTTDYFDEEFVGSDERLKDWPQDIDVEQISADVDTEAFLKKWDEYIDDHKRQGHSCTFIGKRSLDRRCSQRRSLEEWYGGVDLDTRFDNTSALVQRHVGPVFHADISLRDIATLPHGMHELDKRNPIAWLFEILAQFGTRMAVQVAARATASVAANSPRLANLLKTPERLFQTAAKGQGTKAGQKGMEGAKEAIKKDAKRYWKCLKEGKP